MVRSHQRMFAEMEEGRIVVVLTRPATDRSEKTVKKEEGR